MWNPEFDPLTKQIIAINIGRIHSLLTFTDLKPTKSVIPSSFWLCKLGYLTVDSLGHLIFSWNQAKHSHRATKP